LSRLPEACGISVAADSVKPLSVLISMGSNIDPALNLWKAFRALDERFGVVASSKVYQTLPALGAVGPSFLNAALELRTQLGPEALKLEVLRPLEAALGRVRSDDRNAPRTIDLDISYHGDFVIDDPESGIRIPDPDALRWAHVALPLADLDPDRRHPEDGRSLAEIARGVPDAAGVQTVSASLEALASLSRDYSLGPNGVAPP
jgi:2-amino-4-hydroxy-6-hydroxymethyldihydropteridine diphosphokinase